MLDIPILAKDALREGSYKKNYIFTVQDRATEESEWEDSFVIDNDTLVSESVSFDEAMCSDKELKFGLCEGTSLEFQYFDHENINGKRIRAEVEVFYPSGGSLTSTTIPMGYFIVDSCPRQASTGIYKVTAYNKLKSDYLDAKANNIIKQIFEEGVAGCADSIDISIILELLLNGYSIESNYLKVDHPGWFLGPRTVRQDAFINWTRSTTSKRVWVIALTYDIALYEYPGESYIPEHGYYREPDWYYTGYVKWWANLKKIYDAMMDRIDFEDHLNDDYQLYLGNSSWHTGIYKMSDMLTGTSAPYSNDYLTYTSQMVAAAGANRVAKLSITPENYQSDSVMGPIAKRLKSTSASSPAVQLSLPFAFKEITINAPSEAPTEPYINYFTQEELDAAEAAFNTLFFVRSFGINYLRDSTIQIQRRTDPVSGFEIPYTMIENLPDVTLRELQSALFEVACQYGQIDRVSDLFYGKELGSNKLYPDDALYPDTALYPSGTSESGFRAQYSKMWTDTQGEQRFRRLIITYKGLDDEDKEKDFTLTMTINSDGTTDYNMSDNWIFRNMIWTEQQVSDYATLMISKMQNIKWFPFEMWLAGLPYIETGDELEIIIGQDTYTSYVLRRTLKGIQNLQDTYINGTLDIF